MKDFLTFDLALRHSRKTREQVDALANRLLRTSSA
jgi:hypothetical protein